MVAKKKKSRKNVPRPNIFLESIVFNGRYEMCANTNKLLDLLNINEHFCIPAKASIQLALLQCFLSVSVTCPLVILTAGKRNKCIDRPLKPSLISFS